MISENSDYQDFVEIKGTVCYNQDNQTLFIQQVSYRNLMNQEFGKKKKKKKIIHSFFFTFFKNKQTDMEVYNKMIEITKNYPNLF